MGTQSSDSSGEGRKTDRYCRQPYQPATTQAKTNSQPPPKEMKRCQSIGSERNTAWGISLTFHLEPFLKGTVLTLI